MRASRAGCRPLGGFHLEVRRVLQQLAEVMAGDDKRPHRYTGGHRGCSPRAGDERDLAEEASCPERGEFSCASTNIGLAIDNDKEIAPWFPLLPHGGCGGILDFANDRGDLGQLPASSSARRGGSWRVRTSSRLCVAACAKSRTAQALTNSARACDIDAAPAGDQAATRLQRSAS
jgi:hypothetical protein